MKNILIFLLFLFSTSVYSQVDYSDSWEDFYSYNNVKDFIKVDNQIFALVDNAVFTFNETTSETKKISSIQGLSGEITSAIYYDAPTKRLVIGYDNGLIEVIDEDNSITISSLPDIDHQFQFSSECSLTNSNVRFGFLESPSILQRDPCPSKYKKTGRYPGPIF